jgi:hypothetical protein
MSYEVFDHPTLGALLLYWQEKRRQRRMPARHDIDPIEMDKRLLPHLMLCELGEHGNLVRLRLVGTSLAKRLGFDPTGQLLSDLPKGDYFNFLGKLLRRTYTEAAPLYGASVFCWGAKGKLEARHLLLPLSAGGADPGIVLVGTAYSSDDVFPPQIRILNGIAQHFAAKCEVVSADSAAAVMRRSHSA